jgi:hypothetical protein
MSYCRFGDNDAYIFLSSLGLECCGCIRAKRTPLSAPYTDVLRITHTEEYDPVYFKTAQGMLDHIAMHRANGDHISLDVDASLRREFPDLSAPLPDLTVNQ